MRVRIKSSGGHVAQPHKAVSAIDVVAGSSFGGARFTMNGADCCSGAIEIIRLHPQGGVEDDGDKDTKAATSLAEPSSAQVIDLTLRSDGARGDKYRPDDLQNGQLGVARFRVDREIGAVQQLFALLLARSFFSWIVGLRLRLPFVERVWKA